MTGHALTFALVGLVVMVWPWSLVPAFLLAATDRGPVKVAAYAAGYVLALAVVMILAATLLPPGPRAKSTGHLVAWIELVVGILLALFVLVFWIRRRRHEPTTPKWLSGLDRVGVVAAFLLGLWVPNYALVTVAVAELTLLELHGPEAVGAAVLWVLVATLGVVAPLVVLAMAGAKAEAMQRSWREWLVKHSSTIISVVLGTVSVVLIVKGGMSV
ncbi:GAP family protein [Rhodococcus sp. BP-252]|uniref:GAP family protein n=1 Tax=unclassified Rhodococcus (in: high G+C Gram-positive bacteria) TaxID=192944 RepID=UPI001C9B0B48|nr:MULTISPECIES: GAP family protein [unclassified Rhodococcus (in: high G+C Gram-positive bacteria)]MBY6414268.1 GAP family protein [Rhodococcus sp. BP-320]MBY6419038.1 GAP family protein [Rhodococcus sp. BP-321]MBY6423147.1 GAP family protein [Rhodococcus sp. BP-324]MBY6429072.1 GAP family protein [Rhodococcus sp. BP-323]MBY6434078.1 GAP family protein [Rhodococcus sp. BP-322]